MPQVTVYVRRKDLKKWKAIEKKAEFIHNALDIADKYKALEPEEKIAVKEHIKVLIPPKPKKEKKVKPKVIKTPQEAEVATASIKLPTINLCKIHGVPLDNRGKCLQKGCKYA